MASLIVATLGFIAIHLFVSGTRLRDRLVGRLGEGAYTGLFSAASLALIVWMAMSYGPALTADGNAFLWRAPGWWPHLGAIVVLIAFVLGVLGMLSPNPGAVGQAGRAAEEPRGIQRVTRHPFLWGVGLWAAFHLVANGDLASLILFGGFAILALGGTVSIDAKRRRKLGAVWDGYAARTSNLPFAAILGGRQRLVLREFSWWRLALALAAYALVFVLHPMLFGVSPTGG
ncbi:MAG: NnrU family protein [Alphaproteobacteria bacterium]|nr:NnrU family protein [Alphaproteobacteria bacterium]MCB9929671.1 NnrU family protein [Alphaproteobacteria bacterium]